MTRSILALTVLGLAMSDARADVAPPKGQVRVPVDYVISTNKDYPDYVFVVVIGADAEWSKKAELTKDKPLRIEAAGRGGRARLCWLAAVPADAAKGFKSDKELFQAVIDRKIPGLVTTKDTGFSPFTVRSEKDAPKLIEEKYKLDRLDKEAGIVLSAEKVGRADDPDPHGLKEESAVRWAVAGVAAALAVSGLGLWLIGRRKS
jgi:hypothetical protein